MTRSDSDTVIILSQLVLQMRNIVYHEGKCSQQTLTRLKGQAELSQRWHPKYIPARGWGSVSLEKKTRPS